MNQKLLITISILLKGERLDPDYISETLGIQPNESQRKGEQRGGVRPNSKTYTTRIGNWWFSVDNKTKSTGDLGSDIHHIVDEVFQVFEACKQPLDKLTGVDEAYLDILVLQDIQSKLDNIAEFTLNKNQVLRASRLGLAISVTTSFSDPNDRGDGISRALIVTIDTFDNTPRWGKDSGESASCS